MRSFTLIIWGLLTLTLAPAALPVPADAAGTADMAHDQTVMSLHHMHTLMDHGLVMVLEGSNLVMLSQMGMAAGLDPITREHGRAMMTEGKAVVREVLTGNEMKKVHESGRWNDPLMGYTHELGAEMLAVVDDAEKMDLGDLNSAVGMKLHHVHIALNHALIMAVEGSDLVMVGKMQMTGSVDERSIAHGRKMLVDARKLWGEVVGGQTMKDLLAAGVTPEASPQMARTVALARHGEKLLALLDRMNALKY